MEKHIQVERERTYFGALGNLGTGAVVVKAGEGREVFLGQVRCRRHGDQRVGVRRVAHHHDLLAITSASLVNIKQSN